MNRDFISRFIFILLLTSGVLLVVVTQYPGDVITIYNKIYCGDTIDTSQNNMIGIYVTIINGLSYVLCSCVLGLSIVVSRIKD